MSGKLSRRTRGLVVALACSTVMTPASAEILLGATRTSASIYGGASYLVDWNGGLEGGTTLTFSTTERDTRIAVTFNAECTVMAAGYGRWVNIDILVDPAGPAASTAVPPSNGDNAFCSGNETNDDIFGNGDGWISASTQTTMVLREAGEHTVRVRVDGEFSGVARLDDMSLIVQR